MKELVSALGTFLLDTLEVITTGFAIFVVIFLFVVQIHQVNGDSMLPNFHDKEFVLTDKLSYRFKEPQRGEVVIFKAPPEPNEEYIKRIIALPGEKVKIQNNQIFIYNSEHPDGFVLNEDYLAKGMITEGKIKIPPNTVVEVPENSYMAFGDNRTASSDSRVWGQVRRDELVGRAFVRIWPLNKISIIHHAAYNE